jgi:hypothetical protein
MILTFTITNEGGESEEITINSGSLAKFRRGCKLIREALLEMSATAPQAQLYLDDGTPYLLGGPSHDFGQQPLHENVIESFNPWPRSGGGGW